MRILQLAACASLVAALFACTPDRSPPQLLAPSDETHPIFYGETTPTLYTGLSAGQQAAVVALCTTFDDQCFCSGSLISPRVVLTAGHCIDTPEMTMSAEDIEIHVGSDSSYPDAVLDVIAVEYKAWQVDYGDDVGVAVLSAAFSGATPLPIRHAAADSMVGQEAQAVGFGMTQDNDFNDTRYWTTLDVEAVDVYGILVDGHGVTGVAPGDSGSPLLYDFGGGVRVAGIASTSEDGWVYSANYTSVYEHEAWIQSIVDAYESPACQSACAGMNCGTDQGCFCGSCDRGEECVAGSCQEIPAGSGGACVTGTLTSIECSSDAQCTGDERCYTYSSGSAAECGEECGPEACSPYDTASYCYPFLTYGGSYAPLCVEGAPASCSDENGYCATPDGRSGYCLDLYYDGTLACYGRCATVVTCPEGTACLDVGGVSCSSVCQGYDCGFTQGCDCGSCPGTQACVGNLCQPCTPSCEGRACGPDSCGGSCGSCESWEYCNAEWQCVTIPGSDAGSGDRGRRRDAGVGPSPEVSHTVAICGCGQAAPTAIGSWILLLALGLRRRRR